MTAATGTIAAAGVRQAGSASWPESQSPCLASRHPWVRSAVGGAGTASRPTATFLEATGRFGAEGREGRPAAVFFFPEATAVFAAALGEAAAGWARAGAGQFVPTASTRAAAAATSPTR
ncbi:MAG: hypothetical protein KIT17_12895 [Rubrivivax sp.]|nr:hypothetical protein [Rubrivivax sp.]